MTTSAPGTPSSERPPYSPPRGVSTSRRLDLDTGHVDFAIHADWLVLREDDEPLAEVFHVAYLREHAAAEARPITFVFNGGPGASSAYLHMGALGPARVAFDATGAAAAPPARLVDNRETWLAFTDLVFVDPVGTGLSRIVDPDKKADEAAGKKGEGARSREFFGLQRDLESLGEFIQRFLSRHHRWTSPVYIAGESYGGFRVGKLARKLQEGFGVGLSGAILISPALEWVGLVPGDYDVLHFVDSFPTMVAAAHFHGRCRALAGDTPLEDVLRQAEAFAGGDLALLLVNGALLEASRRDAIIERAAALLGLPAERVRASEGRVRIEAFARALLREERAMCGLYDATITAIDPFPDRDLGEGPDPTLFSIERVFSAGINAHLRTGLGLETERDYRLLSLDVNKRWKLDTEQHVFERHVGATDDLRYAMSLNPHMKVLVSHGIYDLVTPYFSSNRQIAHMKLAGPQRSNLTTRHFPGGHMFYTWDASRAAFRDTVAALMTAPVAAQKAGR